MKVLVLYRPRSDHRQLIEEMVSEFKRRHPTSKVELMDIDRRDGMATASLYDIMRYPAILALRNDGTMLQSWEGTDNFPKLEDLSYYALDNQ